MLDTQEILNKPRYTIGIKTELIKEIITVDNSFQINEVFETLRWISSDVAHNGHEEDNSEEKNNCISKLQAIIETMTYMQNIHYCIDNIRHNVDKIPNL